MEMRLRPKSDYLNQATIEELYVLTRHWESDMAFYKDELRFLHRLVDRYFLWLSNDESIVHVQDLVNRLKSLDRGCKEINTRIREHIKHMESWIENAFSHDEQAFRDEHATLEDSVAGFVKRSRELRKETFMVTENIMDSEQLGHLLGS